MFSFDEFSIICASFMHELQTGKNPQKWSVQIQKDPSQASLFSVYLSDGYITIDSPVFFKINYTKPLAFDVQNINSPYQEYDHFTSAYLDVLRQVQFTKDAQTTFSSIYEIHQILQQYPDNELLLLDQFPTLHKLFEQHLANNFEQHNYDLSSDETNLYDLVKTFQQNEMNQIFMFPPHLQTIYQYQNQVLSPDVVKFCFNEIKQETIYNPFLRYLCIQIVDMITKPIRFYQQPIELLHPCNSTEIVNSFKHNKQQLSYLLNKLFYPNQKSNQKYQLEQSDFETIQASQTDIDIFNNFIRTPNQQAKIDKCRDKNYDRAAYRIKEITPILDIMTIQHYDPDDNEQFNYLDFGGQNGELASKMQSFLQQKYVPMRKEHTHITDLRYWAGFEFEKKYSDDISFQHLYSHKLPYQDKQFNLITCFMVLHHVDHVKETLKEFYRILKPNGILIIREHDIRNKDEFMLADIEHTIQDFAFKKDKNNQYKLDNLIHMQHHKACYLSRLQLRFEMEKAGLICVTESMKSNFLQRKHRPDDYSKFPDNIKGSTRYYYDVYQKSLEF